MMEVEQNAQESYRRGEYHQSIAYAKQWRNISKETGDKEQEAAACNIAALSCYCIGDYKQSIEYSKQELQIVTEVGNSERQAAACDVTARSFYCVGEYRQSIEYCKQALSIAREVGDKERQAAACRILALSFYEVGDYIQSIESSKEELAFAREEGDGEREASVCDVLARSYLRIGEYKQSIEYGKKALSIAKDVRNREREIDACTVLSGSYYEVGDYKQSVECGKRALSIAKEVGNRKREAEACAVLAWPYYEVGGYKHSIEYGKQALRIAKETGNRAREAAACSVLARSYYEIEDYRQSIEYGKQELVLAKELANREAERKSYDILARSYRGLKNDKTANEYRKLEKNLQKGTLDGKFHSTDSKEDGNADANKFPIRSSSVPNEIEARGPRAKLAYENALKTGKVKVYRARIMLIGQDRAGKTSLKKSFLGLPFDPEEASTEGIEVDQSKFDIEVDHVKNWQRTDEKFDVSYFVNDIARMVATEIQELKETDRDSELQNISVEIHSENRQVSSWLDKLMTKLRRQKRREREMESKSQDETDSAQFHQSTQIQNGDESMETQEARVIHQDVIYSEGETSQPYIPELKIDPTLPPDQFTQHLLQYLNGLNLPTHATAAEHRISIDLWDFAGQHLYYASYPVFLSPRAVYLLVYNLSKGLKETAQPCFRQGVHDILLANPNNESNLENLLSWLVSLSSMCSLQSQLQVNERQTKLADLPYCRPPVFIVGTHADKPHEDIAKMELQIQREISGMNCERHVIRPFFSVDNTQGSSDEGVAALQKRMIEVLKQEQYMGEEVPIRWFNFEKVVQALVSERVYFLNLDQLRTIIEKVCFIEEENEAATMLDFYHDLGMIVKHRNTVVLRAQWLIDVFKQLITVRSFSDMEPRNSRLWKEMETTGVLDMELVDHVFSKCCQQQGLIKEDILNMMEQFGLIVKFATSPTNEMYFVPCQLKSPPDALCEMGPSPSDPCPLYLNFLGGFVPHGFFWQLVSRCTRWCSGNGFGQPPRFFHAAALFFIKSKFSYHLVLLCKKRFIKIALKPTQSVCGPSFPEANEVAILVRTFLEGTMQNLRRELPWLSSLTWDLRVACPGCQQVEDTCSRHVDDSCDDEDCLCLLRILEGGQLSHCPKRFCTEVPTVTGVEKWFAVKALRPGYHPGTDDVYNMTGRPRGITLIINNASFTLHPKHGQQSPRHGSEEDVRQVEELFIALGFEIQRRQNLSRLQLLDELDDVACQDHSAYDCFVLWLMSHGRSGEVFCSDGNTIPIQTLHDMFSNSDTLSGKPKLFFIQACRGDGEDEGVSVSADTGISSYEQLSPNQVDSPIDAVKKPTPRVPTHADFLYAFSTVDEHVSYRHEALGSYYVRGLVEAFRERAVYDHLLDILTVVNKKVSNMEANMPSVKNKNDIKIFKQMPEVKHTLRKKVCF